MRVHMNKNTIDLSELRLRKLANFYSQYSLLSEKNQVKIRNMIHDLCAQEQTEIESYAKDEKILDLLKDF